VQNFGKARNLSTGITPGEVVVEQTGQLCGVGLCNGLHKCMVSLQDGLAGIGSEQAVRQR
jgi:hypothetical protein